MIVEINGIDVEFNKRGTTNALVGSCPFCDPQRKYKAMRANYRSLKARCKACRAMVLLAQVDFGVKASGE